MWRILRWVLLAFAVLIAAVLALPFLVPTSVYKDQIIEQARLMTGRELKIDGDLSISFWPSLGVAVNKVSFANAPGAAEPNMATMESLVVGAEFFPLLSGNLKVTEVKLVRPVINLEIDAKGRGNWRFEAQKKDAKADALDDNEQAEPQDDLSFRDVRLTEGVLTYRDQRTKTVQRVEAIDVSVKLPSLDEPMALSGGLTWNGEAITIDGEIAKPRALSSRGKSAVKAKINGSVLNATFEGTVDTAGRTIKGKVDLKTESAHRLASWAGIALPKVKGFGPMTLSGEMSTAGDRIAFDNAQLSLDDMKGSGNLALATAGETPHLKGDFKLDKLDINPYLGNGQNEASGGGGGGSGWSDASIDLSALRYVDADFAFAVDAFTVRDIKIGRSALDIVLSKGKMRADLKELALYGGNGRGVIALDGSDTIPRFGLELSLNGVAGEAFLRDAIDAWRLSGTGSIVVNMTASGRSERAWMRSLDGRVGIRFQNGAVKGIDLGAVARTIETALTGSAIGPGAKTSFSELSASFVIKGGIGANRNLRLISPEVRLDGAGLVDIGNETLDYRLEPKALSSSRSLGGRLGLPDIGIPFRVKGSWDNPSYEPDLSGVMSSTLDAILQGDNPLDKVSGGIEDLLKPAEPAKKKKQKPKNRDPLDQLKDLFGN